MKIDLFRNETLEAAEAYMGRLSQRYQIVASNLANIDTPGYKTKDISFNATMQELLSDSETVMNTSRPEHKNGWIPVRMQAQPFEVQGLTSRSDENNVNIDEEMVKMSKTTFGYSLMSQIIRGKLRTIASSINEGRA